MFHLSFCYGSLRGSMFPAAARAPAALVVSIATPRFPHDPLTIDLARHYDFPLVLVSADGPEIQYGRITVGDMVINIPTSDTFFLEWNADEIAAMYEAINGLPDGAVVLLCLDPASFPTVGEHTRWVGDLVAKALAERAQA